MKNKKKKLFVALALGALVLSGFAVNAFAMNDNISSSNLDSQAHAIKEIKNNPYDFLNAAKIALPDNFNYIDQLNKEFVGDFDTNASENVVYKSGDSLKTLEGQYNQENS